MKVTIQRQCDGDPASPDLDIPPPQCEARLHLDVDVADRLRPDAFQAAWVSAAISLGWRRFGSIGEPHERTVQGVDVIIPVTRTWVLCAACVTAHGLVCAACATTLCACACPAFDVREP